MPLRVMQTSQAAVPRPLAIAAAFAWRILVVGAAVFVLGLVVARLRLVVVPIFVALLATTFLMPPAAWLKRRGWPDGLAALAVVASAAVILAGIVALLAPRAAADLDALDVSVRGGVETVEEWLVDGPLDLSQARVNELVERVEGEIRANASQIVGGALAGATIAIEVVAGLLLALVLTFFFLKDGPRLWQWIVWLFAPSVRSDVDEVGKRAWATLGAFLRGTAVVAAIDAVFIGLALIIIGVPLVIPLALLTFVGGFIPIVGAFVAGFAAIMVALVSSGVVNALVILAAVVLVQQLEGNVLQPFVVGRTVRIHPVVVVVSVTTGGVLWGVIGAFVAVPTMAATWAALDYLRSRPALAAARDVQGSLTES